MTDSETPSKPALTDRDRAERTPTFGERYGVSPGKILHLGASGGVGRVASFMATGRRIPPIHEIGPRRDFYIPGKTQGEAAIKLLDADYAAIEARMLAASCGKKDDSDD